MIMNTHEPSAQHSRQALCARRVWEAVAKKVVRRKGTSHVGWDMSDLPSQGEKPRVSNRTRPRFPPHRSACGASVYIAQYDKFSGEYWLLQILYSLSPILSISGKSTTQTAPDSNKCNKCTQKLPKMHTKIAKIRQETIKPRYIGSNRYIGDIPDNIAIFWNRLHSLIERPTFTYMCITIKRDPERFAVKPRERHSQSIQIIVFRLVQSLNP